MTAFWEIVKENWPILFSGIGVALLAVILTSLQKLLRMMYKLAAEGVGDSGFGFSQAGLFEAIDQVVDVYIEATDGSVARLERRIRARVLAKKLDTYIEPVNTVGKAENFATSNGAIIGADLISGYYLVEIKFPKTLKRGSNFENEFSAELLDTFPLEKETWAPRIGFNTKKLTMRIHFPKERGFKLHSCSRYSGWTETKLSETAAERVVDGRPVLEWVIKKPKVGDIYKLEWYW